MTIVYDPYNHPPYPGVTFDAGVTQAEHARDCDINVIMEKYLRSGTVAARTDMGTYGDFSEGTDFHEAQNLIIKARGQFGALSGQVS